MRGPLWLRIAGAYAILFLLAAVSLGVILGRQSEDALNQGLRDRLVAEARAVAATTADQLSGTETITDTEALSKRLAAILNARVTLIAANGTVLGDSEDDPRQMENHLTRPEVQQALAAEGAVGYSERHSATLNRDMMYVAVAVPDPAGSGHALAIVRVSLAKTAIEASQFDFWRNLFLLVLLIAAPLIAVALVLARGIAAPLEELSRVVRRLGAGDLSQRAPGNGGREIKDLAQDINTMADRLSETIKQRTAESTQMAAVLANMTDAIITTDERGVIVDANPAARRLFSHLPPQNHTLIEFTREHELHNALKRSLSTARRSERLELSSGRRVLAATVTAVPPVDAGRPTGLVVLQDVTELRRLERVRRDFVANISHELRTPLASIKLLAETLDMAINEDPGAAHGFLERIDVEIDRLTQLVRELLELSRIESGQVQLQLQPASPLQLINSAAARLAQQAERARVGVTVEQPTEALPLVAADSNAIEQVLVNLLHNAIKFTPPGGKIVLSAFKRADSVAISVRDSGIGIDPDDLPRLFERFYKVDKARTGGRKESGTGLGLAIAKHIIQAHGGTIWAESKLSAGSTFTFTLPLALVQSGR